MADNKNNRGAQDRARVSGEDGYELVCFANKHDLSIERARMLIAEIGSDRQKLDEAAEKFNAQSRS